MNSELVSVLKLPEMLPVLLSHFEKWLTLSLKKKGSRGGRREKNKTPVAVTGIKPDPELTISLKSDWKWSCTNGDSIQIKPLKRWKVILISKFLHLVSKR